MSSHWCRHGEAARTCEACKRWNATREIKFRGRWRTKVDAIERVLKDPACRGASQVDRIHRCTSILGDVFHLPIGKGTWRFDFAFESLNEAEQALKTLQARGVLPMRF